ncbi:nucleotide-binding domain-containing protein, partial [Lactobacillus helveticus]
QLRGKIFKGRSIRREHTKYKSMRHYVECYVVDNDVVIARSKLIVPIGGYEDAR